MDYGPHVDTSGTDDDLPPSYNNRVSRGGWVAGNGRSVVSSIPISRVHSEMESKIHQLEQEAYSAVLRAFKAQSDALTWEKEGLITELRKELRVSDDEHRELLTRVNADDIICRIREWRQASGHHGTMLSTPHPVHDLVPSPTSASRKKQKMSQSVNPSFGVPLRSLHSQAVAASVQPSHSAEKRGPTVGNGGRRVNRPGQPVFGLSSLKSMQYTSTGTTGMGHFANRGSSGAAVAKEPAEAATRDPLIGRKVMTRWPEDNTFYEAVITDYNPLEGRHALVYDIHTAKETWEWVNLKEISPDDIRWVGEDPGISQRGGHEIDSSVSHGIARRERGSAEDQLRKELPRLQNGVGKVPNEIEILHTETLIKEVERVFDAGQPDLLEIQKAKKMLKDHEQALIDVIDKLADASDSESEQQIPNGQKMNGGWRDPSSNNQSS
ncbi:protein EMSY-LIKE 3-like isoform X3 [Diospyros lotus]|uniref:protein EMSY-LIKE 3-like isoform X3 n=1 Tax=Diospyros lotus TaxID=55363 RepID=UPI0022543751|nr:protein EMSY-LIKE 3-like isoform X3 [Diospyros lotus]